MNNFYDQIDTLFIIEKGKIPDNGEDSFSSHLGKNNAYVGVFDGCGGSGFRTCRGFSNKTEAYMASRFASGAVYDWFEQHGDDVSMPAEMMIDGIRQYLTKAFTCTVKYNKQSARIGGGLVRDFPSTAAVAYLKDDMSLNAIWAGDSRVYLMDSCGLAQVSVDDINQTDAYKNLFEDGVMNNVLSADGKYNLNLKTIMLSEPTLILTCTDGCFGYFSSPMEFEYIVIDSLVSAKNIEEFKAKMKEYIQGVTGDDFSMGVIAVGYGSFKKLRDSFKKRFKELMTDYIKPIQSDNGEDETLIPSLWEEYKPNYERYF